MKIIKKNLAKKTIVMTEPMRWEAELLEVYETAASTDDRSDIECVISYVRDLLAKERQQVIAECLEAVGEVEKNMTKPFNHPAKCDDECVGKPHYYKIIVLSELRASLRLKGKI